MTTIRVEMKTPCWNCVKGRHRICTPIDPDDGEECDCKVDPDSIAYNVDSPNGEVDAGHLEWNAETETYYWEQDHTYPCDSDGYGCSLCMRIRKQ